MQKEPLALRPSLTRGVRVSGACVQAPSFLTGEDTVLAASTPWLVTTAVRSTVAFPDMPMQSLAQPLFHWAFRRALVAGVAGASPPPSPLSSPRRSCHALAVLTSSPSARFPFCTEAAGVPPQSVAIDRIVPGVRVTYTVYFEEGSEAMARARVFGRLHTAPTLGGAMVQFRPVPAAAFVGIVNVSHPPPSRNNAAAPSRGPVRHWLYRSAALSPPQMPPASRVDT